MGDRICILRDGRIEQTGAPLEVYARPANTFVAQFLASPAMNLIPATLAAGPGGVSVRAGPVAGPLPPREAALYAKAAAEPAILGLRAEDLLTEPAPHALPVGGRVVTREVLGSENLIGIETEDGTTLSARTGRHFLPAFGDRVTLHADLSQMHLFRAADGTAWPGRA